MHIFQVIQSIQRATSLAIKVFCTAMQDTSHEFYLVTQSLLEEFEDVEESEALTKWDQPDPIPNDSTPIHDLVIEDLRERKAVGLERYGTYLQAFNGRNSLADAYCEVLDLIVYLRQYIEEQSEDKD